MPKVFLNLGSNVERDQNFRSGLSSLKRTFGDLSLSSIYESEPVGFDGACFYNMAVSIETELSLPKVIKALKTIEDSHGRLRGDKHFAPRTLDIDVVSYGQLTGFHDGVELPRPELYYNGFVLWPMAELAPDDIDSKTGLSYQVLWQLKQVEIEAKQKVWRVDPSSVAAILKP
jgi:2-amino-4-hydroxy-6-hydroxymethyldihydropteridine diphosphokinase